MGLIKKIPIPISGLVLALISLGNLLQDIHPYLKYLFGLIGVIFIILLVLKVILYSDDVRNDFKNPVILSSSGTFSMALMILSTYLIGFTPSIAYALWIIGVALHILLMIFFTYRFMIRDFNLNTVYPTYWIVYIGITMGAITAPFHGLAEIAFIFFIIGFIAMILTFPLVIYRYFKNKNIPDMNKPLICIFNAVMSILIVGYLNSANAISFEFVFVMYSIACAFYLFSLYKFIEYRNLDFFASFSAFTFPFVISTTATKGVLNLIKPNFILSNVLIVETAIATIIVLYVLIRYIIYLKKS